MIGEPLDFLAGFSCVAEVDSREPEISSTMAWFKQPSAWSSAPRRCISRSKALPELSIKLTPQRFTMYFCLGEAAMSSRQHCSTVPTEGPAIRPSTVRVVFPRLDSVVILSISTFLEAYVKRKNCANGEEFESVRKTLTCMTLPHY